MTGNPKLIDKLSGHLPPAGRRLLEVVLRCADYYDLRIYAVGGTARDLLLDRPSLDIDIAVEGDAIALAKAVAESAKGEVAKSTEFGTSTVKLDGFVLDLASTRAESYPKPGSLPKVRPSNIDGDLLRRDFSMNAVAIALNGPAPNRVLDPIGGVQDLRSGQVRVLHDRSFQDDATRMIRGVRYERRFGFRFEERTYDLLRRDLSYVHTISGTRIRQELQRTLAEDEPEIAFLRMQKLGLLETIHPGLRFGERQTEGLRRLREMDGAPVAAMWAVLAWEAEGQAPDLGKRLALTVPQRQAVLAVPEGRVIEKKLGARSKSSAVAAMLDALPVAAVCALAVMAEQESVREKAVLFLTLLRTMRPLLRGEDVIALGVERGPRVGDMLDALRVAKLDGEVSTRADEEAFVRRHTERGK